MGGPDVRGGGRRQWRDIFLGGRRGKTICRPKTRKAGAKEFTYRSSTIGRELNISLGVNFCFGLGKH